MTAINMVDYRFVQKIVSRFCAMTDPVFSYRGLTYSIFGANSPYTSHQAIEVAPCGPTGYNNLYIPGYGLPWDDVFCEAVSFHLDGGYNGEKAPEPEPISIEDHGIYWEKPRVVRIPAKFADDCTRRINDNRWCVESLGNPIRMGYQTIWATIHRLKKVGWQWGTEYHNQNRIPITVGEFYEWEFPSPESEVAVYRHHDGTYDPHLILSDKKSLEGYDWIGEYNPLSAAESAETRDMVWIWRTQPAENEQGYSYFHSQEPMVDAIGYRFIHRKKPEPRQPKERPQADPMEPVVVE